MKASILFITYKHEEFVAAAIRAAMFQDYPEIEIVVCDDGSPDGTRTILETELADCPAHIDVIWASANENVGLHANFNRGLASCTGDVIVIMSGDDVSLPHRVSTICKEFSGDPQCMLVCSNWRRIDDKGRDLGNRDKQRNSGVFSYAAATNEIYAGAPICGAAAAYRATIREYFPEMRRGQHAEDNVFWVRALLVGDVRFLSEVLVLWRAHGENQSNWINGSNYDLTRDRHLKVLRAHQYMLPQWSRDYAHALATDLISRRKHDQLMRAARIKCEYSRLLRFSVTRAPKTLWLRSFYKLLSEGALSWFLRKSFRKKLRVGLLLRISARKRAAYWRNRRGGATRESALR